MGYLQVYCWANSGRRQACAIRVNYFRALMRQEIGWYDRHSSGALSSQIADSLPKIQDAMGDKVTCIAFSLYLATLLDPEHLLGCNWHSVLMHDAGWTGGLVLVRLEAHSCDSFCFTAPHDGRGIVQQDTCDWIDKGPDYVCYSCRYCGRSSDTRANCGVVWNAVTRDQSVCFIFLLFRPETVLPYIHVTE